MSPPVVVFAVVVLLAVCESSRGASEAGWQELVALDEVLKDLQSILETRRDPPKLLTEALTGVGNASTHEGTGLGAAGNLGTRLYSLNDPTKEPNVKDTKDASSLFPQPDPTTTRKEDAKESSGGATRRVKRVSPTPPPSLCPQLPTPLPAHLSKWEQLKYLVLTRPSGCHHHDCCQRRPDPCPHKPEVLVARLALLEERVREVDRLEARLKIHITLLTNIQASPKFPGEAGEPGAAGRKGHQGFKGVPGPAGPPGTCRITGHANPSAGPPGPPGNKGLPGPPGDKVCGCDGDRGDKGLPGTDRRGRPGPRGAKGQKGERGRDIPLFPGGV